MSAQSITPNKELMAQARADLRGNWLKPVLVTLIFFTIGYALYRISLIAYGCFLLIEGPIAVSFAAFYLSATRKRKFSLNELKIGIRQFFPALFSWLLILILIFLWSLLLIIPGVIAALSYSMVFYIRCDNPELSVFETLKRSKKLMYGNRWKYLCLICRFIGWGILAGLTFGIGHLWLTPYIAMSQAHFYEDLLRNKSYNE